MATAGSDSALAVQVGGDHYKSMAIQPVEFALVNGLNTCQANIVKYVCRYRSKGGAADLRKAAHYCDLWMQLFPSHHASWDLHVREQAIPVQAFVLANRIEPRVADIVQLVCHEPTTARVAAAKAMINTLLADFDG